LYLKAGQESLIFQLWQKFLKIVFVVSLQISQKINGALMDTPVVAKQNNFYSKLSEFLHYTFTISLKELSDCPENAICMAVSFLYKYFDIIHKKI
jgi:hypothetical protein